MTGTIGKLADGTWFLFTGKNDKGKHVGFHLGNYNHTKGGLTKQDWIGEADYNNPMERLKGNMEFENALKKESKLDKSFLLSGLTNIKNDPDGWRTFPNSRNHGTVYENEYNDVVKNDKNLQKAFLQKFSEINVNDPSRDDEAFTRAVYKLYIKGNLSIPPTQKVDFLNRVYKILTKQDPEQQTQTAAKK